MNKSNYQSLQKDEGWSWEENAKKYEMKNLMLCKNFSKKMDFQIQKTKIRTYYLIRSNRVDN